MSSRSYQQLPRFADFQRIVFFTGAGLSAESGIPTYRGVGGIWHEYDYSEYACQRAFDRDPNKVWDFHDLRRAKIGSCQPNDGHKVIAAIQQANPTTRIVTQNIDGLHTRAGAQKVIELHGSLWRVRCDAESIVRDDLTVPMTPRRCSCGAYWRPDIVWFEDMLSEKVLRRASRALEECDLLVSVGTSGLVYPAAALPQIAAESGAVCVEINLQDTPVSNLYSHHPRGPASEILKIMAGEA